MHHILFVCCIVDTLHLHPPAFGFEKAFHYPAPPPSRGGGRGDRGEHAQLTLKIDGSTGADAFDRHMRSRFEQPHEREADALRVTLVRRGGEDVASMWVELP